MKKVNVLVLGVLVAMGLSSCIKDGETYDPNAQYQLEKPIIEEYVSEHLINPQYKDIQGYRVYFEIIEQGTPSSYKYKVTESAGNLALIPAEVIASYEGRLVSDNSVFQSKDDQKFIVPHNVIPAWQLAFLPNQLRYDEDGELLSDPIEFGGLTVEGLQVGSVIRIVTPSYLAYQNVPQGNDIPANSPLYFEITVSELNDYDYSN